MATGVRGKEIIGRIVKKLVAEYAPQRVILFGSYAYGSPDEDSDIDLLIVKQTDEGFFERLVTVRRAVAGLHRGVPFDPIVLTPAEVKERLERGDQFLAEVIEKGEFLHDDRGV